MPDIAGPDDPFAETKREIATLKEDAEMLQRQIPELARLFNNASDWDMNDVMHSDVTLHPVLANLFLGPPTKSAVKQMHAEFKAEKTV